MSICGVNATRTGEHYSRVACVVSLCAILLLRACTYMSSSPAGVGYLIPTRHSTRLAHELLSVRSVPCPDAPQTFRALSTALRARQVPGLRFWRLRDSKKTCRLRNICVSPGHAPQRTGVSSELTVLTPHSWRLLWTWWCSRCLPSSAICGRGRDWLRHGHPLPPRLPGRRRHPVYASGADGQSFKHAVFIQSLSLQARRAAAPAVERADFETRQTGLCCCS